MGLGKEGLQNMQKDEKEEEEREESEEERKRRKSEILLEVDGGREKGCKSTGQGGFANVGGGGEKRQR